MKLLFAASLLIIVSSCNAQSISTNDSVSGYLRQLDNNAVSVVNGEFSEDGMSSAAKALYQHPRRQTLDQLMDSLASQNRVLACHVLLTLLLEPGKKPVYHTSEDLTDSISFLYQYNGFAWRKVFDKTNMISIISVTAAEIERIQLYWRTKKDSIAYKSMAN